MPRRKRLFTLLDLSIDICALRTARSLISAEYAMSAANQEVAHTSSGAGLGYRASLPRRVLYQMSTLNSGRAVERSSERVRWRDGEMARWEESPSPARASNQRHAQSHSTSRWAVCTRIAIAVIIVIIVIHSSSIFARTVKVGHELLDLLPVFLRGLVVLVRLAALSDRVPVHVRDALVRVPRKSRNGDHVSAVGGGLTPLDLDFGDHVCDSGTWHERSA